MKKLILVHLYPTTLSLYGDLGNVLTLVDLAKINSLTIEVVNVEIGDALPVHIDILCIGGGADESMALVCADIVLKKKQLYDCLTSSTACLAVCAGYQLFGNSYTPANGTVIYGIDWFPCKTTSTYDQKKSLNNDRCIGPVLANLCAPLLEKQLVGFENHGGQTKPLSKEFRPLSTVVVGNGNSKNSGAEGCIQGHAIGTYMHGPVLPKNYHLAIQLLEWGCEHASIKHPQSWIIPPEYQDAYTQEVNRLNQLSN